VRTGLNWLKIESSGGSSEQGSELTCFMEGGSMGVF
jgi:hypothetical protein